MKKFIILLLISNYLFAITTCTNNQNTSICYYKVSNVRSIIVTNMKSTPIFFNVKIIKDNIYTTHDIKNVKLEAYQKFKIEEIFILM